MSGLRKLFNIVQNLDPLILQDILADQPYLMRLCELELGPEDSEDETIEFTGSVEIKRVYFHEDLPWDAYVNGVWGDGYSPVQALKRAIKGKK